jgi:hypothetical protein
MFAYFGEELFLYDAVGCDPASVLLKEKNLDLFIYLVGRVLERADSCMVWYG